MHISPNGLHLISTILRIYDLSNQQSDLEIAKISKVSYSPKHKNVIVSMLSSRGVPILRDFSNAKRALSMTLELSKSMRCSIGTCFDIPDTFFLTSFKTQAGFTYITPITIGTGYSIKHVRLMFNRWSEFGRRKFWLILGVRTCNTHQ